MKNGILILLVAFVGLSISCGGAKTSSSAGGSTAGGTPTVRWNDQAVNQALCTGTAATNPPQGRWALSQSSGAEGRIASLVIQANSTTLSYTCTLGTTALIATAMVPSTYDGTRLHFTKTDSHQTGDPRKLLCQATLELGYIPYVVRGQCLTINIEGVHTFTFMGN